ncbi:MAG: hypothetical protein K4571_03285 [Deltaproteobacteria bacterium]
MNMPLTPDQIGIIISVYKIAPSREEDISIRRALEILNRYRFFFVAPRSLDLVNYKKFFTPSTTVVRFSDRYFGDGLEGYNQLMLGKQFYAEFLSCKYLLIYHPDAYVFRDDLMEWCKTGYDYIGAPWTEDKNGKTELNGVGNGGFSLRKVESFLRVLDACDIETVSETHGIKQRIHKLLNKLIRLRIRLQRFTGNRKAVFYRPLTFNEDGFWGLSAPAITTEYKTAPQEIALKFSFDTSPDVLYRINRNQLPFGCHAWARINPAFWKKHIQF